MTQTFSSASPNRASPAYRRPAARSRKPPATARSAETDQNLIILLGLWTGSFEIDRAFDGMAKQLGLSIFDLAGVREGYRVLSFLGLGALLLGTSVLYGKLSPKLLEDAESPAT